MKECNFLQTYEIFLKLIYLKLLQEYLNNEIIGFTDCENNEETAYYTVTDIQGSITEVYEGKYYCYATSSDHYSDGFSVWISEDLVNWSEPIHCFNAKDYWGESHFWAPEVIYHNGKFIMHYTARSSELKSLRLGVAVSDSPTGPFVDVHNRPMFDFGYAAIDGSILISKEGNYLYYSRDCSENVINGDHTSQIYCVEVNDDLTEVIGEPKLMTTPELPFELKSKTPKDPWLWNEGPFVIYRNGEYIMNYSANCYATNDYAVNKALIEIYGEEAIDDLSEAYLSNCFNNNKFIFFSFVRVVPSP